MKKILAIIILFFSANIFAAEIGKDLNKEQIINTTKILCKDINNKKLENHELLSCINILKLGSDKGIFFSYYTFYNAIESNVNFKNLDSSVFYNKMKNLEKNEFENNLFVNIKK